MNVHFDFSTITVLPRIQIQCLIKADFALEFFQIVYFLCLTGNFKKCCRQGTVQQKITGIDWYQLIGLTLGWGDKTNVKICSSSVRCKAKTFQQQNGMNVGCDLMPRPYKKMVAIFEFLILLKLYR